MFTNGYNADLTNYSGKSIYWRVRALDYDGNPLGVFSDAQQIFVDHHQHLALKPLLNEIFNQDGVATPLFPVYSWVPIAGAKI